MPEEEMTSFTVHDAYRYSAGQASEWVEFNTPRNTIWVISEAKIAHIVRIFNANG